MVPENVEAYTHVLIADNILSHFLNHPCLFTGMDDEENDTSPLHGMLDDKLRVFYFKRYLAEVAQAIKWVLNLDFVIMHVSSSLSVTYQLVHSLCLLPSSFNSSAIDGC